MVRSHLLHIEGHEEEVNEPEKDLNEAQRNLFKPYTTFFENVDIIGENSVRNGILRDDVGQRTVPEQRRFATMPHVGNLYDERSSQVLFVGENVGKDTSYIHCFEQRRQSLASKPTNKHMKGTFLHAAWLLQQEGFGPYQELDVNWDEISITKKGRATVRGELEENGFGAYDPLSRVALTNLYKFEQVGTSERGDSDKGFVKPDDELKLLEGEINQLEPDIIVLQGDSLFGKVDGRVDWKGARVLAGYHPSYRGKNMYDFEYFRSTYKKET